MHGVPVAFAEVRPSQAALPLLSGFVEVGAFYTTTGGFNGGAVDAASLEKELVSLTFHVVAGLLEPELKLDPQLSYTLCLCLFALYFELLLMLLLVLALLLGDAVSVVHLVWRRGEAHRKRKKE